MHILTVEKTTICSDLKIELWTFHYPREDHNLSIICVLVNSSSTYELTANIWYTYIMLFSLYHPVESLTRGIFIWLLD